MDIIIADNRWVYLNNMTPDAEDLVDAHFSVKDPNFQYITDTDSQSWDGYYHKYNRYKQRLSRGFLRELCHVLDANGIPYEIDDRRPPSQYPMFGLDDIKDDILAGIKLMPHQLRGLKTCTRHEMGLFNYITGAGKTELMCAIAKLLGCPTVIIAEERVVIDQIRNRLELRDVADDVGVFYAGKSPTDQLICVGSLASFSPPGKINRKPKESTEDFERRKKAKKTRAKNLKKYRALIKKCELLMIDEADRACNKQYKKLVMQQTQSRYLYGFTGTMPEDGDDLNKMNLRELLGDVISKAGRRQLEEAGRIIPVKYIAMTFGEPNRKNKDAFDIAVKKWINENADFHQHVKKITESLPNDNFLILVESVDLGKNLEKIIPDSIFIYGQTPTKKRNKAVKAFEQGQLRILIGSRILKRGLDLDGGVHNVIICASSRKNAEIEQKIGRAVRRNDRGWARVFDHIFLGNHYLYQHSRKRLKHMISLGYPTIVATGKKNLDGKRVIRPGFNLFRYV